MIKKGFSYIGIYFLYGIALLPLPLLYLLFFCNLLHRYMYLIGYRKKVVRENLQNSFPGKKSPGNHNHRKALLQISL